MDRQAVYNKVRDHLLAQGVRCSAAPGGFCLYRARGGRACAIGALIADEHYSNELENGYDARDAIVRQAVAASLGLPEISDDDALFLGNLQGIHDGVPPEMWAQELRMFARRYGLQP